MAEAEMRWYVMRAVSGKEGKVKEYIDAELKKGVFGNNVSQVLVPTEKVVQVRNGKRVIKTRNHFPGYVLVEAMLVGETAILLRRTPNVLGFLGESNLNPTPLRQAEVNRLLGSVDEMENVPEDMVIPFERGEMVKVTEGPFTGFSAMIEEVNNEKKKLRVMVKIFGRKTPLELGFMQVEKE